MRLKKLTAIMMAVALLSGCGCGSDAVGKQESSTTSTATVETEGQESTAGETAKAEDADGAKAGDSAAAEADAAKAGDSSDTADAAKSGDAAGDGSEAAGADGTSGEGADAGSENAANTIEAGISEIEKYGNVVLTIGPESLKEMGYEPADLVNVTVGDTTVEMPIGTNYSDVATGSPICVCKDGDGENPGKVSLAINMGNFAEQMGIAKETMIDEDPGFKWDWCEGFDENTPVKISLSKKQGYADEYEYYKILATRTNERSDYPNLTDAEYANFREVITPGTGIGTLYRSSSPVNPGIGRNKEADEAMAKQGIRTVINMADNEETMKAYDGFGQSYCSKCDILPLNMTVDFFSEGFQKSFADAIRYMGTHDGPYLMHCNEGKDRTGFAVAVIEALMGASAQEIKEDYMKTYYNFYGVEPGTDVYDRISANNIEASLAKAFGVPDIMADGLDLVILAEDYLKGIGLTEDEIAAFTNKISVDYGGLG